MDKLDQRLTILDHGLSVLLTNWKRMVNEVESIKAEIGIDRERQKALRDEEEFKRKKRKEKQNEDRRFAGSNKA